MHSFEKEIEILVYKSFEVFQRRVNELVVQRNIRVAIKKRSAESLGDRNSDVLELLCCRVGWL